jgi:Bacterial pre-peptidase C-terminal domain
MRHRDGFRLGVLVVAMTSGLGCTGNAGPAAHEKEAENVQVSTQQLTAAEPIEFGEIKVATFGCTPVCDAIGSRSEGWYDGCTGELLQWDQCAIHAAYCEYDGNEGWGWYSTSGRFIMSDYCGGQSWRNRHVVYTFEGVEGQQVDVYADGLLERRDPMLWGIDTVIRLYDANGALVAYNDDVADPGFIVRWNRDPNPFSAHVGGLQLPSDGVYYLVVTAHWEEGSAEVVIKTPDVPVCATALYQDSESGSNYYYVENMSTLAQVQEWNDYWTNFPEDVTIDILDGACDQQGECIIGGYAPVCGTVLHDEPITFDHPCSFRSAVLERAGSTSHMKGYFDVGSCE